MNKLVFTCGDINGIGPEITIKTLNKIYHPARRKIIYAVPSNVFIDAIAQNPPEFDFEILKELNEDSIKNNKIIVLDMGKARVSAGKPTKTSGSTSFKSIKLAHEIFMIDKDFSVITPPISKTSFEAAGIRFDGQTELFAALCKSRRYLMMFLSNNMIAGLATIHIPLRKVSGSITVNRLKEKIEVLRDSLIRDFGKPSPKIAVLGLNPHAGENGRIGGEENEIIEPLIKHGKIDGLCGPFVPDAFFGRKIYTDYDAYLGMYHDQVLIPFKLLNSERGVNFTAGLPLVRTSPDHGTAFRIAWQNKADHKSMSEAVRWAEKIAGMRKKAVG